MADNTNGAANGQALPEQNQAQLSLQRIYVKDVSFEAPGAPQIFSQQGQPNSLLAGHTLLGLHRQQDRLARLRVTVPGRGS